MLAWSDHGSSATLADVAEEQTKWGLSDADSTPTNFRGERRRNKLAMAALVVTTAMTTGVAVRSINNEHANRDSRRPPACEALANPPDRPSVDNGPGIGC